MKKWIAFLLAVLVFFTLHEGAHALVAGFYGEFDAFHVRPIGMEVTFNTPVPQRSGIQWAYISGVSNIATLAMGYILLMFADTVSRSPNILFKATVYYLTVFGLFLDALNLSVGPFLYGGDANGIAVGLGVNRLLLQAVFFTIFLVNHEIVTKKLLPAYNVETESPVWKPWFKFARQTEHD